MDRQQDSKRLNAFDIWCLQKILQILYTRRTTNDTVRSITGCLPVSKKVGSFRLRFFGHLARSAPEEDHQRVIAATLRPPPDWRRPPGRPRSTWLRVIDEDVQLQKLYKNVFKLWSYHAYTVVSYWLCRECCILLKAWFSESIVNHLTAVECHWLSPAIILYIVLYSVQ